MSRCVCGLTVQDVNYDLLKACFKTDTEHLFNKFNLDWFVFPGLGRMFTLRRFPEPSRQFCAFGRFEREQRSEDSRGKLSPHSSVRQLFPRLAFWVILE